MRCRAFTSLWGKYKNTWGRIMGFGERRCIGAAQAAAALVRRLGRPRCRVGSNIDDPNDDPKELTWLVSGNQGLSSDAVAYEPESGISVVADPADTVEIVGAASLGASNRTQTVSVPKVDVEGTGAYAYWVTGEASKANIRAVPEDYPARVDASDPSLSLVPQRYGIQMLDAELQRWSAVDELRAQLIDCKALNVGAGTNWQAPIFMT